MLTDISFSQNVWRERDPVNRTMKETTQKEETETLIIKERNSQTLLYCLKLNRTTVLLFTWKKREPTVIAFSLSSYVHKVCF